MKKKTNYVILSFFGVLGLSAILGVCILAAGCQKNILHSENYSASALSTEDTLYPQAEEENTGAMEDIYTISAMNVTEHSADLTITNHSMQEIDYGEAYSLRKMDENGVWRRVEPIIDNAGFNSIAYIVDAQSSRQMSIDWEWLYGKLPKGTYMITITIQRNNDKGTWDEIPVSAIFEL